MRIALGIEYDGTAYNGWQHQHNGVGIQSLVEKALSVVADEAIEVTCAGRTDSGVHASGQVVHFDSASERATHGWLLGANSNLPDDISVSWARAVDDEFHARFSATARHYRYRIFNQKARSSLNRHRAWWVHQPLDEQLMQEGAEFLLGEHDFSTFRAAGCQASSPHRDVKSITITRNQSWISLEITANAFLQHMVRNISGTLVSVGSGERIPEWVKQILESRDRRQGGIAAPPHGLTLVGVTYPNRYALDDTQRDAFQA
jgi:tRNA pseudouridine38-40 synthase